VVVVFVLCVFVFLCVGGEHEKCMVVFFGVFFFF